MLKINLSKQTQKFLQRLPTKQGRQIAQKLTQLRINPTTHDAKKLIGLHLMRADCGEYRIIYDINTHSQTIEIELVGKRNDDEVYRKLQRK